MDVWKSISRQIRFQSGGNESRWSLYLDLAKLDPVKLSESGRASGESDESMEQILSMILTDLNSLGNKELWSRNESELISILKFTLDLILSWPLKPMAAETANSLLNWLESDSIPLSVLNMLWKILGRFFVTFSNELLQTEKPLDLSRVLGLLEKGIAGQLKSFTGDGNSKVGIAFLKFYFSHWMTFCRAFPVEILQDEQVSLMHIQSLFRFKQSLKRSFCANSSLAELRALFNLFESLLMFLYKNESVPLDLRLRYIHQLTTGPDQHACLDTILLFLQSFLDFDPMLQQSVFANNILARFFDFFNGLATSVWLAPAMENDEWSQYDQSVYSIALFAQLIPKEMFPALEKLVIETMLSCTSYEFQMVLYDAWISCLQNFHDSNDGAINELQKHVTQLVQLTVRLSECPEQCLLLRNLITQLCLRIPSLKVNMNDLKLKDDHGRWVCSTETGASLRCFPGSMRPDEIVHLISSLIRAGEYDACIIPLNYLSSRNADMSDASFPVLLLGSLTDSRQNRFLTSAISFLSRSVHLFESKNLHQLLEVCIQNVPSNPALLPPVVQTILSLALIPFKSIQPPATQQSFLTSMKKLFQVLFHVAESNPQKWLDYHLVCYTAFVYSTLTDWPVYLIFDQQLSSKWMRYLERKPIKVESESNLETVLDFIDRPHKETVMCRVGTMARPPAYSASLPNTHEPEEKHLDDSHSHSVSETLRQMEFIMKNPQLFNQIKSDSDLAKRMDLISSVWLKH